MRIGSSEFRDLLHIRKAKTGELSATIEFTDTGGKVVPVTAISVSESRLIFRLDPWKASYEGTISPDASAISGVWKDAGKDRILNFRRSTAPKKAHDMPSDINGYWTGTIKYEQPCGDHTIKGESLYVFHIFNTTEGLTATWDVPYSGDFGWLAHSVTRDGASLDIEMNQVSSSFQGILNEQKTGIEGTVIVSGTNYRSTYPLVLTHSAHKPKPAPNPPSEGCSGGNGMLGS